MTKQNTATAENNDLLVSSLTKIVRFYKKHTKRVLSALVIIALVIAIGVAYTTHVKKITENSWAAYYKAQVAWVQEGQEAGFKKLDEVVADFKGTSAAQYAQLLKGDLLFSTENFAQAVEVYKPLTSAKNETVRTSATLSQAAALQAVQDYNASIELLKSFIEKNPKNFTLPQAYLTLAMSQELAGNKLEAIETYKYLSENHTKTYFGAMAKNKLAELQK